MTYIPPDVSESPEAKELASCGLKRIHQGKVRDTYELADRDDLLLVVATDRVSIFDFVLGAPVQLKGEVLTALTVYFLSEVLKDYNHHLLAFGGDIDRYIPNVLRQHNNLQRRALVVFRREMMPVECVVRGVLTGSAWEKYAAGQRVLWEYQLSDGLQDGAWLDQPMFTPTDKAESGHDEPVTREYVRRTYGSNIEGFSIAIFNKIRLNAREKGVIFADTKFEFDRTLMICDEVATPDSSRYWDIDEYRKAQKLGKAPSGYDKQPVREWGKNALHEGSTINIGKLDPKKQADAVLAGSIEVPAQVRQACTNRYLALTKRLTGLSLSEFQKQGMLIDP